MNQNKIGLAILAISFLLAIPLTIVFFLFNPSALAIVVAPLWLAFILNFIVSSWFKNTRLQLLIIILQAIYNLVFFLFLV